MIHPAAKVVAGKPFLPSASVWNAFIENSNLEELSNARNPSAGTPSAWGYPCSVVRVSNPTASAINAGSILAVTGGTASFPDSDREASRHPVCTGATPTAVGQTIAVLLDCIRADGYGRAVISGVTCCTVNITDTTHEYATLTVGSTEKLTSSATGHIRILAKASSGTGDKVCMVLLQTWSAGETVALVKCTSNTVNGDGLQPGVLRVSDGSNGRTDGDTVWMKKTSCDKFRNNHEYLLLRNGDITSESSARALYDGPAATAVIREVCDPETEETYCNREWYDCGVEVQEDVECDIGVDEEPA